MANIHIPRTNGVAAALEVLLTESRIINPLSLTDVWDVLKAVLNDHNSAGVFHKPDWCNELAISIGSRTIALKLLFEEDTLSTQGEFFAIYPGRLSHGALLRDAVVCSGSSSPGPWSKSPNNLGQFYDLFRDYNWTLAQGTIFRPPDARRERSFDLQSDIFPQETFFQLSLKLVFRSDGSQWKSLDLDPWMLVSSVLGVRICEDCPHDPEQPFIVPNTEILSLYPTQRSLGESQLAS